MTKAIQLKFKPTENDIDEYAVSTCDECKAPSEVDDLMQFGDGIRYFVCETCFELLLEDQIFYENSWE